MKIRNKVELKDLLDKDFAWRLQELSIIRFAVNSSTEQKLNVALRTSVMLLYSHWEGFIKNAATYYINLVKNRNLKFSELKNCFVAISLKQKINLFEETNKATIHTQFIEYIKDSVDKVAIINENSVIKTGSNLNSAILKEILTSIGLDYSHYELKANLIDEQLLNYRNSIAHGEFLKLDQKEYNILHDEVWKMMRSIKTEIENAAALELYKA